MINTASILVEVLETKGYQEKEFNQTPFMAKYQKDGKSVTLYESEYKILGVPLPIPYPQTESLLLTQLNNFQV